MNESLLKHDFKNIIEMYNNKGLDDLFFGKDSVKKANKILDVLELKNDKMRLGLEIPLSGEARYDLIGYCKSKYCNLENFVCGYPKGSESIIDFAYNELEKTDVFIEYDISNNNRIPGTYIIPRDYGRIEFFNTILHKQGQDKFIEPVFKFFNSHPSRWTPYYCIYFDNRGVDTVRVSFVIDAKKYANNSNEFIGDLQSVGYNCFSDIMIKQLNHIVQNGVLLEVMFDVYSDGSFGPVLGFSTFLNIYKLAPWIPEFLKENNLADERSELIKKLSFFNFDEVKYEGESKIRIYGAKFNSVKFRWDNGNPIPAKIYLVSLGRFIG